VAGLEGLAPDAPGRRLPEAQEPGDCRIDHGSEYR
jgi:hypothetical protein